ncbi:MAG TPA: DUF992 domain-containing protein [Hyphomicrobiaceae bacterium]|jgi:hypothetical protein|nr:DUF992 domain-containing protein [Hyphomicrobiaceae bacterium]
MLRQWQWIAWFAALGSTATPVAAEAPMDIGILTCALAETVIAVPGAPIDEGAATESARDIHCWFRPFRLGPEETYVGTVRGAGQVRELFKKRVIIWTVTGTPSTRASPGLLQQAYAADPKAAPGFAPTLIGEARAELTLQPMADQELPVPNEKMQPLDAIIISVELTLKSSPG